MRTLNLRFTLTAVGLVLFACPAAFGQNPLAPTEPLVVDVNRAYPTTVSPPGSPFLPVSYDTSSIVNQLAHSSTGIVQLAPGDYSVPVRIYCTNVHATGTQHGLAYRMAPMEGKRAPLLIALESRAAAARPPFQQLQQLIWQIMGGLSYTEMPPQSQSLVDQLIPEYRNQLNEDFITALQKRLNLLQRLPATAGLATDIELLIQRYQVIHNTLIQDANNFDALEHQMVNIIPGTAQNTGPSSWSQVNNRVYERLADGNVYGQLGHLQIRVLPSSLAADRSKIMILNASFRSGASAQTAVAQTNSVDVPINSILAYPNAQTMQALVGIPEGGNNNPASQARFVLEMSVINLELQPIETDLMWVDCTATSPNLNPPSAADVAATLVTKGTNLGPVGQQAVKDAAEISDLTDDAFEFVDGDTTGTVAALLQAGGFNCSNYDATNSVKKAAQDYLGSLSEPWNKTSMQVEETSDGSLTLQTLTGSPRVQLKLTLVPCSQSAQCSASSNK